jgi:hypothetical protein
MPDLVYVEPQGWQSGSNGRTPWLLAWEPISQEVLALITNAWVLEGFTGNRRVEMGPSIERVLGQLLPSDLAWQDELIDFSRCDLEPNGTARPTVSFFKALPDLACSYLSHTGVVFPIHAERLHFRRV